MAAPETRFRLRRATGEFADAAMEHAFRAEHAQDARLLNRIAFSLVAASALGHIATDYILYGLNPTFYNLLAVRLATVFALLLVFPLTAARRPIRVADGGVFALQLLLGTALFSGFLIIPAEYLFDRISVQSVTALLLVIGQYLFVSNRVPFAAIAGLATSACYFAVTIATGRLNASAFGLEAFVHVLANAFGIFTVYRAAILRRRQFALAREQAQFTERLEAQARQLAAQAQELEAARDAALQANRAKSEFLAYMSHELRSPMNAIVGFSEMMKHEVMGPISPPKYREYVGDMHDSAAHLLSLINDMLDLSKAEAGKLRINEDVVDVAAAAEAARRLVAVRAADSRVVLHKTLPASLPRLSGDARMVKQMVLNLLSNAIKFTPARGVVTLSAGCAENGALFVSVTDTGAGIAAADIPRILEAYGRTASAERGAAEGTGLGLTLVKAMIEHHGGTLEIASEPGRGSTFTLRFPPERSMLAKAA